MLRITTHDQGSCRTLQLEGKLAGPWVTVLRDCWERQAAGASGQPIHVDLRAVTFVDAAGRALLTQMCSHGAHFFARDCQMKAILAEITHPSDESR
jgi:ABC-type transporter Mla MlaB component